MLKKGILRDLSVAVKDEEVHIPSHLLQAYKCLCSNVQMQGRCYSGLKIADMSKT